MEQAGGVVTVIGIEADDARSANSDLDDSDDLPAFCARFVEAFFEGGHAGQAAGA